MKSFREKFRSMSKSKRIQLILALVVSFALCISLPVAAWFGNQRQIIKLQKIQSPNLLILSSAHRDDKMFFEIDGINTNEEAQFFKETTTQTVGEETVMVPVTEKKKVTGSDTENQKTTHKDYVFSVTGDAVEKFTIQLAYTTNNPFTYQVFAAKEYDSFESLYNDSINGPTVGNEVNYVSYTIGGEPVTKNLQPPLSIEGAIEYPEDTLLYYAVDNNCTGTTSGQYVGEYKNKKSENGKDIAKSVETVGEVTSPDSYFLKTYPDTHASEEQPPYYQYYQKNAVPIYWQATNVEAFPGQSNPNKKAFTRNFILRVSWPANANITLKETDIIYISVKATS